MRQIENLVKDQPLWGNQVAEDLSRFPIHIYRNQWVTGTDYHRQPGLEIHITQAGTGTMVMGRRILKQFPRSVLVFWGDVPHQMISKSSYKRTVVCLDLDHSLKEDLPPLLRLVDFSWVPRRQYLSYSLDVRQFRQLEQICESMREEFEHKRPGWERMVLSCVLEMSVLLQRNSLDAKKAGSMEFEEDIVQLCADYVAEHLDEDLTLRSVAKHFAVSEEHLTRKFKQEIGISFYRYVLLQRIAEGKRLLLDLSDVPVTDIAFMIGFRSSAQFSRYFKALTGETPTAYRRRNK